MPIPFARVSFIKRSRGHSVVQRLAYLLRSRIVFERTGQIFDFSTLADLVANETLVPAGSANIISAHHLWEKIESASKRADASLGFELVLSLPTTSEMAPDLSVSLARAFVQRVIVDPHMLAATLAVHLPHGGDDFPFDDEDAGPEFDHLVNEVRQNLHAHVLVTPRQWTPDGPAKGRYTALDPMTRKEVTTGRDWGKLWGLFQNEFFAKHAPELRTRPNPPIPRDTVPLAEVRRKRRRARRMKDQTATRHLVVSMEHETRNSEMLSQINNAMACFDDLFTRAELEQFYARYYPLEIGLELVEAAIGLGDCIELRPHDGCKWFAGNHQVQYETAAFARALLLSQRTPRPLNIPSGPWLGFRQETQRAVEEVLEANDFVFVEASGNVSHFLADLARTAEKVGLLPVLVPMAAGHPPPKAIIRTFESLASRPVSDALILLDDADSLTPSQLSLVSAVAIEGKNKLVLVRRDRSDWPMLELLDLIRGHARVVAWTDDSGSKGSPALERGPPRSAVTYPLWRDNRTMAGPAEWPLFAMDLFGNLAQTRTEIAKALFQTASCVPELAWAKPRTSNGQDLQLLTARLAQWVIEEPEAEAAYTDTGEVDLDLQEAAVEALAAMEADKQEDDLVYDPDDSAFDLTDAELSDYENEWTDTDDFDDDHDHDV